MLFDSKLAHRLLTLTVAVAQHFNRELAHDKIPYKTCRFLILLEPFSQKGIGKYQKSIGFPSKSHMQFRHVEKPYETC